MMESTAAKAKAIVESTTVNFVAISIGIFPYPALSPEIRIKALPATPATDIPTVVAAKARSSHTMGNPAAPTTGLLFPSSPVKVVVTRHPLPPCFLPLTGNTHPQRQCQSITIALRGSLEFHGGEDP